MITSKGAIITDEIRPFSPMGRTRLTKSELQDVTFANAFAARAALGIPENFAPLVAGKVPKDNLPPDVIYTADLAGISGDLSELDQIVFHDGDGTNFPGFITQFVAATGGALTTLPFTILFPKIAFSEEYLNNPPAGNIHLSRYCNGVTVWGHAFSVILVPSSTSGGLQVRHYGSSPTDPESSYYRVSSVEGMVKLAKNPFSLVVVNKKTEAPILYHNGNLLPTTEDTNNAGSGPPANGWATTVAEGYWVLGMNAASSIPFRGSITPPMTVLGAFSATEARIYGKHGILPAWSTHAATTNTITSGSLLYGRKYRIINNSGGADFSAAGAPDNNVGTEFVVKTVGTIPTWGSGALVQLGMLCAPQTSSEGCYVLSDSLGSKKSMLAVNGANSIGKRRSDAFHYRLFWNNTHEPKSLYGTASYWKNNRVKIDSITLLASGNTTVDVGDGSSGTYFASGQALTANTPVELALANKFLTSGFRIVVDPSANYTGTIDVICNYTML